MKEYGNTGIGLWRINTNVEPDFITICRERSIAKEFPATDTSQHKTLSPISLEFIWRRQTGGEFVIGLDLLFVPTETQSLTVRFSEHCVNAFNARITHQEMQTVQQDMLDAIQGALSQTTTRSGDLCIQRIDYHVVDYKRLIYRTGFTRILRFLNDDYLNTPPDKY
ncbi:MAG: hypothetical protein AAF846_00365 [Chloroflexota bacterium]